MENNNNGSVNGSATQEGEEQVKKLVEFIIEKAANEAKKRELTPNGLFLAIETAYCILGLWLFGDDTQKEIAFGSKDPSTEDLEGVDFGRLQGAASLYAEKEEAGEAGQQEETGMADQIQEHKELVESGKVLEVFFGEEPPTAPPEG